MKTLKIVLSDFPDLDQDKLSNLASEFYGRVMETTANDGDVLIEFSQVKDGPENGFAPKESLAETNMQGFARAIQSFKK